MEAEHLSRPQQFPDGPDYGQRKGKSKPHADSVKERRDHAVFGGIGFCPAKDDTVDNDQGNI